MGSKAGRDTVGWRLLRPPTNLQNATYSYMDAVLVELPSNSSENLLQQGILNTFNYWDTQLVEALDWRQLSKERIYQSTGRITFPNTITGTSPDLPFSLGGFPTPSMEFGWAAHMFEVLDNENNIRAFTNFNPRARILDASQAIEMQSKNMPSISLIEVTSL